MGEGTVMDRQRSAESQESVSDDDIQLSSDVLALIAEVQAQNSGADGKLQDSDANPKPEIWSMSQFWYTPETAEKLCLEIIEAAKEFEQPVAVACLSCPTIFVRLEKKEEAGRDFDVHLFEFDKRFGETSDNYTFYNYNEPLNIEEQMRHKFDIIVADPPHVSDECAVKYAQTIRLLSKSKDAKVIYCTAATLEHRLRRLFNARMTDFHPEHVSKLGNMFCSYTNYKPCTFRWAEE